MATVPLFKNKRANCAVVGKSGTVYKFQGTPHGRCWVTKESEIAELMALAKAGEAGIYIDDKEASVDPSAATPLEVMKKKIIQEYLAEQAKVKDAGTSIQNIHQQAAAVAGTDENVLTGSALASQKNQATLTGQDSPALAAAKASLAGIAAAAQAGAGEKK